MTNYFFTSDTHYGHGNIIKYCNRPFPFSKDPVEMDEALIANHNERVKPGDIVYHDGDFSFANPLGYLDRLNGWFIILRGNHDNSTNWKLIQKHPSVRGTYDYLELKQFHVPVILCHYAMRVWNKSHHGSYMFYGHSHGTLPGDSQSTDIGVDCWDYEPVTFEEIEARLKTQTPRLTLDHHNEGTNP